MGDFLAVIGALIGGAIILAGVFALIVVLIILGGPLIAVILGALTA